MRTTRVIGTSSLKRVKEMKKDKIDDNQQTLDDFWGEATTKEKEEERREEKTNEQEQQEETKIINNGESKSKNIIEEKIEEIIEVEETPEEMQEENSEGKRKPRIGVVIEKEMEVRNVYLLDVEYDGPLRKAVCKFYDPVTHDLYLWYDNTNHLPYLLTTLSEEEIRGIP
ncbi:MAG: hypothetical protein KAR35_09405, partial [Candidatus Heimdallarchaeota archaeon]|nr:hypothetical protein [Candidatus Heimdallarchaeota archaeon]MCK5049572.1 hypothetical protein [Candidatus Heimdallarchaeota archaeon]